VGLIKFDYALMFGHGKATGVGFGRKEKALYPTPNGNGRREKEPGGRVETV
jgi:hypothetical protein